MAKNEKVGTKTDALGQPKENFITKTTDFFNQYQKIIYGILIALLTIILVVVLGNKFYLQPKMERGTTMILRPIEYYTAALQSRDTLLFQKALEGDEEYDGFETIIDLCKMTRIGNTARYFAGLCYLNMGQHEEALTYFKKFKKKEDVYWYACQALIGDIYDNMEENANAIKYYKKAVKGNDPYYTPIALFKLGQQYEKQDKWKEALSEYQKIESKYHEQYQVMGVEKFTEKAKYKVEL